MKILKVCLVVNILFMLLSCKKDDGFLKVHQLFTDNMVLQRNTKIPVWGKATPGAKITVSLNGLSSETITQKDSSWVVRLNPQEAGGPYKLAVKADTLITFQNVLIGDVWVCSGQSNMEWPLEKVLNATEEVKSALFKNIRVFDVPHIISNRLKTQLPDSLKWNECTPENMAKFSAVGYFFGKHLNEHLNVPIGLISSNWGGTNIEAWMSESAIQKFPAHSIILDKLQEWPLAKMEKDSALAIENWIKKVDSFDVGTIEAWQKPNTDWGEAQPMVLPGIVESLNIKNDNGVFWFKKVFNLTKEEAKNKIDISLGMVDDEDITFLNGNKVGETTQSNVPRLYTVQNQALKEGANVLVVRIKDNGWRGGIRSSPESIYVKTLNRTIPLHGEWKLKYGTPNLPLIPKNIHPNNYATTLFKGMINPLIPYKIKGVIWYQGESNAGRAFEYGKLFPEMIKDWRKQWQSGEFPFHFVQLANYRSEKSQPVESAWAELRASQTEALKLKNTGMAVTIDIGETDDIHPKNKQDVGKRLALNVLNNVYGRDVIGAGPMYKDYEILDDKIKIHFSTNGNPIKQIEPGKSLNAFQIAGEDQKFVWANAEVLTDSTVIVFSSKVKQPKAVRYAWSNNPGKINFYNLEGFPAGPFRTDNWKVSTQK